MSGKPKAPFYLAVGLVVVGLIGYAIYRSDIFAPRGNNAQGGGGGDQGGEPLTPLPTATEVENPASSGITTVDEWTFVPAQRLPPVSGTSDYKPMQDNTVQFALNVWAGWAPIIYANGGGAPGKAWKTPSGEEFKVKLVLIDDPVAMLNTYVSGDVHIGWATLDMLPLFMERMLDDAGKPRDSRVMPRVYQQVDWSNGGDGIVVRQHIKEVKDLKGKKIVLAQNSPSHYFLLNMLVAGGLQPSQVKEFKFTPDAFQAAAAFDADKSIDACVSWAPDIYRLADQEGNKLLVTTATANRLIGDVWFARADFARDNPAIIEGLARGIFDAMDALKDQSAKTQCAKYMSDLFNIPVTDTEGMFADAYSTGWPDNYQFFLNKNYLANFEVVWNNSYRLYRRIGVISKSPLPFDQVMDNSIIKKLGEEEKYKSQVAQRHVFATREISASEVEEGAFLTATHYFHFYPNTADLYKKILRREGDREIEEQYDPNVDLVLDEIGKQIAQFELSRVAIEGHTDLSMRGQVDEKLVKDLSEQRAAAVKQALVKKFDLDPNRFTVLGRGWEKPIDPTNQAKNRRVEVRILPAEGLQ